MAEEPELFDVYDAAGHAQGLARPRAEVHRRGDWHRSAHIWIVTPRGELLFQRRAADKDTWPGRLDASVGGHYRAGEDSTAVVTREAWEELGLRLDPAALTYLGLRRVESHTDGVIDRELQHVYLLRSDLTLTAYRPHPEEIDGLALLPAELAADLHAGRVASATALSLERGADAPHPHTITAADLIPGRGPYLGALARAAGDRLAGRPPHPLAGADAFDGG
jgi:isopentenyldiphosphate isomerase